VPLVAGAVAAMVVIAAYLALHGRGAPDLAGRWVPAAGAGQRTAPGQAAGDPFGAPAPVPRGAPTRLRVPAIGVDTALQLVHLGSDGALTPPKGWSQAGWYADGTAPGDRGPAVIAGHVDSVDGPAVFYRLRELTPGDAILVVRGGRTLRFTVTSTAWYPKTSFPAAEVYGPTPDRELRLITCGGVFDHRLRSYRDNQVVYAVTG
jgi:hypothetical protein